MNRELLLTHFDRVSNAPDAIPRLRSFILNLAVRGKLVEQDQTDEPAAALLKRIEAERAQLIKAGKINKPELVPAVAENEAPFALPATWKWIRIADGFHYDAGTKREPKELDSDRWLLELEDIEKDTSAILTHLKVRDRKSLSTKSEFRAGDILYGKLRPYLNKVVVATEPGYSTTEIVAIRPFLPLSSSYCCLAFRRPDFVEYVSRLGRGTKMPRLRTPDALVATFPLPPLAEQYRIVAKVDGLMDLCDQLEAAQTEREHRRDRLVVASLHTLKSDSDAEAFRDQARFYLNYLSRLTTSVDHVEQLRRTILNLAVRGRLVAQASDDEPASELLMRAQAEIDLLVNEGKRKKNIPLPPIEHSLAPFPLPTKWVWARFPEIGIFGRGKSRHRPRNDRSLFEGGTHLLVQTGDVARSKGVIDTYTSKYNDVGLAQSYKWPKGTLCITIAANIADSGILSFDACFPDSVVGFVPTSVFSTAKYFEYFVRTAKANLLEFAPATAQKNINLEILNNVLIPLPPAAELTRIVAKVDELMSLCDRLQTQLTATQSESQRLLEAVLHEALNPPTMARVA